MSVRWGWTEDDFADLPEFVFGIGAFCFDDVLDFVGVFGGFAGGVEVELAFFLGEEFVFESEALFFELDDLEAMSDARQGIDRGCVCMIGEVVTGMSQFDFYVFEENFGIIGGHIVETGLG